MSYWWFSKTHNFKPKLKKTTKLLKVLATRSWYFACFLRATSSRWVSKGMVSSRRVTCLVVLFHQTMSGCRSVRARWSRNLERPWTGTLRVVLCDDILCQLYLLHWSAVLAHEWGVETQHCGVDKYGWGSSPRGEGWHCVVRCHGLHWAQASMPPLIASCPHISCSLLTWSDHVPLPRRSCTHVDTSSATPPSTESFLYVHDGSSMNLLPSLLDETACFFSALWLSSVTLLTQGSAEMRSYAWRDLHV